MEYSYELIDGGYAIYRNGKCLIVQFGLPNDNTTPMDIVTAEQIAKLVVKKLEMMLLPKITIDEEIELSTSIVNDDRILELANLWGNIIS
jgi:hypothetical protein